MVSRIDSQNTIVVNEKKTTQKDVTNSNIGDINNISPIDNLLAPEKQKRIVVNLNEILETSSTELRFKFHEELKEYYVTIVNSKEEVIREIPSKKLMDIYAAMQGFLGILVDRKI